MLGHFLIVAILASVPVNGQRNYRPPPPNRRPDTALPGPPPPPPPRRRLDSASEQGLPPLRIQNRQQIYDEPEPQIADRRFQDYYYDSDVPEPSEAGLQSLEPNPIPTYDDASPGTDAAIRSRPPPRLDVPVRQGPGLPGLQQYEEYEFDRSCQYSACRCRTVPHPDYADVYFEERNCTSGSGRLIKACPNGLVYTGNGRNGLVSVCDYPHRASWSYGRERHNPPISTDHCDWLYGIFGHETSCTRYWTCWNGTATEQFCIGGLLYNEETHACDWPQNVGGCQKHPLCKDDPNGKVPLGKSCDRYWSCQGGYPRLQRCPAMLVFDKQRKGCVAPPTADCDVPPPPPPEEGDENGFDGGDNGEQNEPRGGRPRARPANRRRFQQQIAPDQDVRGGGLPLDRPLADNRGNARPLPADFDLPDGALPLNIN